MLKQNNPNTDNNKIIPKQCFINFYKNLFGYLFQKKALKKIMGFIFLFTFPLPVIKISGLKNVFQPGLLVEYHGQLQVK